MNRVLSMLLLAVAAVSLSACNTIAGAGKDIERAGETIQGAAKR